MSRSYPVLVVFLMSCSSTVSLTQQPTSSPTPDPFPGFSTDDPYDTSQIVLVETIHQQGYTGEYYENHAYTCGRQGHQSFLVVYTDGLPSTTGRPLWVRMHGGGVGAYDAQGEYIPIELVGSNNQESLKN